MDYNKICEFEAMETEKRFLPYTVGTPSFERTANDQYQRLNLIFFTDSHVDMPWCVPEACDNVERTIDFANNFPVPFDAVLYGGDTITFFGHVEKTLAKERFKCLVDRVKKCEAPFIFARGNHDPNHVNNLPENYLRDEDYSEIYLDYSEEKDGIVRQTKANGQKSIWHYKDLEDKKVRIISLDSEDSDRKEIEKAVAGSKVYGEITVAYNKTVENNQIKWYGSNTEDLSFHSISSDGKTAAYRFDFEMPNDGVIVEYKVIGKSAINVYSADGRATVPAAAWYNTDFNVTILPPANGEQVYRCYAVYKDADGVSKEEECSVVGTDIIFNIPSLPIHSNDRLNSVAIYVTYMNEVSNP